MAQVGHGGMSCLRSTYGETDVVALEKARKLEGKRHRGFHRARTPPASARKYTF
jgi:hypothetical protein